MSKDISFIVKDNNCSSKFDSGTNSESTSYSINSLIPDLGNGITTQTIISPVAIQRPSTLIPLSTDSSEHRDLHTNTSDLFIGPYTSKHLKDKTDMSKSAPAAANKDSPQFSPLVVPGIEAVDNLLRNKPTRRTFELLRSLVDSRLQPSWCEPLLLRQVSRSSADSGLYPSPASIDSSDVRFSPVHTSNQPTSSDSSDFQISPTKEVSLYKRIKLSDTDPAGVVEVHPAAEYQLPSSSEPDEEPPDHISTEVKLATLRLVDFFESRYRERVGDIFRDALEVNTPRFESECSGDLSSPRHLPVSSELLELARLHYYTVLRELFAKQINWGRIIAMFSFLRAICQMLEHGTGYEPARRPISQTSLETRTTVDERGDSRSVEKSQAFSGLLPALVEPEQKLDQRAVHYLIWTTEYIHADQRLSSWIIEHGNWEGLMEFESGGSLTSHFLRAFASIAKTAFESVTRLGALLFNHRA